MNNQPKHDAELRKLWVALIVLAVLIVLSGILLAVMATIELSVVGSGLRIDEEFVRHVLRSQQRIGALALPVIGIAMVIVALGIRENMAKRQTQAEQRQSD